MYSNPSFPCPSILTRYMSGALHINTSSSVEFLLFGLILSNTVFTIYLCPNHWVITLPTLQYQKLLLLIFVSFLDQSIYLLVRQITIFTYLRVVSKQLNVDKVLEVQHSKLWTNITQ